MCITIQVMLPAILAQHTQKTAWVKSEFEDNTLRITDISREQYTRKPLKRVVEICISCANTQKSRKFYWDFFLGLVLAIRNRRDLLRARRESWEYLGKACKNASSASSALGSSSGISSIPRFWLVWLGSPLREVALRLSLHAK
jgi:hypothetical protein